MQACGSIYSPLSPSSPQLSSGPLRRRHRLLTKVVRAARKDEDTVDGGGGDPPGRLVDENMKTLRRRMRETRALDRAHGPPHEECNWMEWEKEYYRTFYESEVCEVLGLLQLHLMNTRPSIAIGATVMVTLSVPVSILVVALHLVDAAKGILAVHLQ